MFRTIAGETNSTPLMYHHRRRVVQVAAVFVAHDVGVQQFVMLPSSSDHQQPQKKRRGSILLEPVPATGSGSASSSGTHLSGVQNLHTEFLLSCMTVSARKRARGSEHMETNTMIVLLSMAKATTKMAIGVRRPTWHDGTPYMVQR